MDKVKNIFLFSASIIFASIALLLCIYYAIPNIYHYPIPDFARPTLVHEKYVQLFGGATVLGVLAALLTRPRRSK
jgi:hypothetical protein